MSDIQVGEYVRTKDGIIAKVTYVDGLMIDTDQDVFDLNNLAMMEIPVEYAEEYILKHSKNIIDLIQERRFNSISINKVFIYRRSMENFK